MANRTAVILQPSYLPWLGYFAQFHRCDVFVVYDDVQYDKHSWRNRNRIKTPNGALWLTVPVLTRGQDKPSNREVKIDNATAWRRKHLQTIQQYYGKAPYFNDYVDLFARVYAREWTFLIDLNIELFHQLCAVLGLQRQIVLSSELNVKGDPVERLIDICKTLHCTHFFEGAAGRDYIDTERFVAAGIELEFQDYKHPTYNQLHGEFVPYLSVVDLLFNKGKESLEVLKQ